MLGPSRMSNGDPDECLATPVGLGLMADAEDLADVGRITAVSWAADHLDEGWPERDVLVRHGLSFSGEHFLIGIGVDTNEFERCG